MTTTIAPAPTGVESKTALDRCLTDVRASVDRVLDTLPERRLEARRTVTRELEINPGAEELQTIERIAHDAAGSGEQRDLSRLALTVRIVADRELNELYEAKVLEVSRVSRSAELLPGLLQMVGEIENEIRARVDRLRDAERDYLLQVGQSMVPASEPLVAATVLAPRLLQFVRAACEDDPRATVPSLGERDVELIRAASNPEEADGTSRPFINALALRTLIADSLVAWEAAAADDEEAEPRSLVLERMHRQRIAYQVVSARLQERQDTALVAGLEGFAEQLRGVKQQLFSVYIKMAAILNDPTGSAADGTKSVEERRAELERLLQECSAADARAEAARTRNVSKDQLYLQALKGMRGDARPEEPRRDYSAVDLRRERRRVRVLGAIIGVLVVALVAVYATVPRPRPARPRIATTDLPNALTLIDAVAVGPMIYAQVSRWTWNDIPRADRLAHVAQLGAVVRERGFKTLYVTDEEHRDLAMWTRESGARLVESEETGAAQPE